MITYLSILNLFNLLLLSILLVVSKNRMRLANHWLAVVLLCMATNAFDYLLWNNTLTLQFPYLVTFGYVSTSLIGPAFFFYVRTLVDRPFQIQTSWYHFLPTVFYIGYYVFFQAQNSEVKVEYIRNTYSDYPTRELVLNSMASIQILVYLTASFLLVRRLRRQRLTQKDNQGMNRFRWLEQTSLFLLVIFLVVAPLLVIVADERFNEWCGQLVLTILYVVLFIRTYQTPTEIEKSTLKTEQHKPTQEASISDELNGVFEKIAHHVSTSQAYQKARYTSHDLSRELGLSVHELSRAINQKTGHNYYHFINSYRVEKAKQELVLPENDNLTIEAIGQKCGFNSLSTFYDVFNRHTHQTPKSFKEGHRASTFPNL